MPAQTRLFRPALLLPALGAIALLGACKTTGPVASGPMLLSAGHAGASSDALFDGPEAAEYLLAVGGPGVLPEYARRDDTLGVSTGAGPLLATAQWPQADQPSLDQTRTIYIPVHNNSTYLPVTYSSNEPLHRPRGPYWRWRY